jgi:type IV secretory pathway VirB6-like protein
MTLTSWDWFVQNYVRLFVVGSLQLAKLFNNSIYKILYNKEIVNSDIFDIFSSYKFVMYLLEGHLIHRLIALIFSSLAGLVIAIIICCGLAVACKVILEGIFVYISAVLTQVLLLLVAPFFMMCNLFEVTKDIFDDWVKNVFLFSIIPSTVVIVVGLFFLLLQIGLDATMGFTYCSCCWFSLMGICFIEIFATLGLMFIPATGSSDFILPTGLVSGAMTFIFIVQIGYIAVNSAVEIISRMITFKAQNVGQGSMTGLGANVFASAESATEKGFQSAVKGYQSLKGTDAASRIKDQKQLKDIGKRLDNIN